MLARLTIQPIAMMHYAPVRRCVRFRNLAKQANNQRVVSANNKSTNRQSAKAAEHQAQAARELRASKMADRERERRGYSDRKSSMGAGSDDPPNSRLFIIGSKQLKEEDFEKAFGEFGTIEEIWVVKDRTTGENKGVTYIKFSKTSEAAKALEAMNDKHIGGVNRCIKVMVAASRDQGSRRDANEDEKCHRLFVIVPKTMTDDELNDYFKQWGDIAHAAIVRDRETKESKGFAYVKYFRFSDAATAYENCEKRYRAVFAEPRKPQSVRANEDSWMGGRGSSASSSSSFGRRSSAASLPPPPNVHNSAGYTKLISVVSPEMNQDQMWRLFDIVPGLDYLQLRHEGRPRPVRGVAQIVYTNPQWAAYAKEKLHGFEYPPGCRIIVKPDYDGSPAMNTPVAKQEMISNKQPDILQIAETIAQASSLIQAAGLSPDILQAKLGIQVAGKDNGEPLCSVKLPDPQPLLSIDTEVAARCFIVCMPSPPPNSVLKDAFCRFGNLIDVYMLSNRNCGYARYGSKESAEAAIKTLHGAEVFGIRLKVLEAEERPDNRKRPRLDDSVESMSTST